MKKFKSNLVKTNCWDFLNNIADKMYNLISVNKILSCGFLIFMIETLIIVIKWPSKDLPKAASNVFCAYVELIKTGYAYNKVITGFCIILLIGLFSTRRVYKTEIKRLAKEKSDLIHGLSDESLHILDKGRNSNLEAISKTE